MTNEYEDVPVEEQDTEQILDEGSINEILEDYRRRQMMEHLTGPLVSFFVHIVLIALAAFFFAGNTVSEAIDIKVESRPLEIVEPPPPPEDEIQETVEEIPIKEVPKVEKPEVTPETPTKSTTDEFEASMDTVDVTDIPVEELSESVINRDSSLTLPQELVGRTKDGREDALREYAGRFGEVTEAAVMKALRWLKETQKPDGSWGPKHPEVNCALGLLAFLAHGETPESEEFGPTVLAALNYLQEYFRNHDLVEDEYINGIIAYALSEGYALTKLPSIKGSAMRAVRRIVEGQQVGGGWAYKYHKGDFFVVSVSGWQMQALKAAYNARLPIEGLSEALNRGTHFFKNHAFNPQMQGYPEKGAYSQLRGGYDLKYSAMSTLCLQLAGEIESQQAKMALSRIKEYEPKWPSEFEFDICYKWYYINQAMFQGGKFYFDRWNRKFAPMLVENQAEEGYWDMMPGEEDKVVWKTWIWTCLNTLSLEVYYRYLPTTKRPEKIVKEENDVLTTSDDFNFDLE